MATLRILFLLSCLILLTESRRHYFHGRRIRHLKSLLAAAVAEAEEEELDTTEAEEDNRGFKNPRNFLSTNCPRDDELAIFMGQKCLRKCSTDEDCKNSKKKRCLCDGLCGMSCVKPDRECLVLVAPTFGEISYGGTLFNEKANYSCELGFTLVGPKQRSCRADGKWSGPTPKCKQKDFCTKPPTLENTRHNAAEDQMAFDIDESIQYQCIHGHVTNGFPNAKCMAVEGSLPSWFGPDISCKPRSCGSPPSIARGWHSSDCTTFGCKIIYHCEEGYEVVGKREKTCQSDGTWFPKDIPICVLLSGVECPVPEHPSFGKAIFTSRGYNSVVSYECQFGYKLVGNATRKCAADEKWTSQAPTCVEIKCEPYTSLDNGWLEMETGAMLGSSVMYRCEKDMLLEGASSAICQSDGTWTHPPPLCLAPCIVPVISDGELVSVSTPKQVERLNYHLWYQKRMNEMLKEGKQPSSTIGPAPQLEPTLMDGTLMPNGSKIATLCQPQYEPLNDSWATCFNGTWSHIPKCDPARCRHLPEAPLNGIVITNSLAHGSYAKFRCDGGYDLHGNASSRCVFGTWSEPTPTCKEKYCQYPGTIEHGKILLVGSMGAYDYRPYVRRVTNDRQITYECDKGYLLQGNPGATCVHGQWSPDQLPRCSRISHPQVRVSRSLDDEENPPPPIAGEIVSVYSSNANVPEMMVLDSGYKTGNGELWVISNEETRVKTTELSVPYNHEETHFAPEYLPFRWRRALSGQNTQVIKSKQGVPKENKDKTAGGSGSRSRSRANTIGDDESRDYDDFDELGFDDMQERKRKKKQRRKSIPCEALANDPFMLVEVLKEGAYVNMSNSHGTQVRIICAHGYKLNIENTNNTAKCMRGRWRPNTPFCQIVPCKLPSHTHGIYTRINGTIREEISLSQDREETELENGAVVNFTCGRGFNINGPSTLECERGKWNVDKLPECTPAACELPFFGHGQYASGYRAGLTIANGSYVGYQCDHEFVKEITVPISCYRGVLLPKAPHCKRDPMLFKTGHGVARATNIGSVDILSGYRGSCGPPDQSENAVIFKNGQPLSSSQKSFPDRTEISFNCVDNILGDKLTWRIVCVDGSWMGNAQSCSQPSDKKIEDDAGTSEDFPDDNTTCMFRNTEPNMVTFYNDELITDDVTHFPAATILTFRCTDIGKYAMEGSKYRKCSNGEWDGEKPACFGLNQENAYALEKPPTILFRHENGPIAQSNEGKLIVYPGATLHMECLWMRRFGTPKWNVSHSYRKYPEGWTTEPGRDSTLEYRLTIYHAIHDDSGVFTCTTPTRHSHSIDVVIKAIHCPRLSLKEGLRASEYTERMSSEVTFSCVVGYALKGFRKIVCLPSGKWSAPVPECEIVQCPELHNLTLAHMKVAAPLRFVGNIALFSCTPGYTLHRRNTAVCLPNGRWERPFPYCTGTTQCPYPGTVNGGRLTRVEFYYPAGDSVTYECDDERVLQGASKLICLPSGDWSNALPYCALKSEINVTTSVTILP